MSGRSGARRDGGAGRGGAGWDADGSVRPGNNRPSYPRDSRIQLSWACLWKHEQSKIICKPMGEHNERLTRGLSAVRFNRGTTAPLRSWLLANAPAPNCLCKPFSRKACPGICMYLSNPKPGHTTGGRAHGEAIRGDAGRGRTGRRRIRSPTRHPTLLPPRASKTPVLNGP